MAVKSTTNIYSKALRNIPKLGIWYETIPSGSGNPACNARSAEEFQFSGKKKVFGEIYESMKIFGIPAADVVKVGRDDCATTRARRYLRSKSRRGVNVMITIFRRFSPIFGEKIGVFLSRNILTNIVINFLNKLAERNFSQDFSAKIFKNHKHRSENQRDSNPGLLFLRRMRCPLCHAAKTL
jgi:hypothetical protein